MQDMVLFLCLNSNKRLCVRILILSIAFLFCDKTTRDSRSCNTQNTSPFTLQGWKHQVAAAASLSSVSLWKASCCFQSQFKTNNYSWQLNMYESKGVSRDTYHHQEHWLQ